MQDCDISYLLSKEQISDEPMHHNDAQLELLHFDSFRNSEIPDAQMHIQIQDDPFHSYQREKKRPLIDLNNSSDRAQDFMGSDLDDPKNEPNEENILGDTESGLQDDCPIIKEPESAKKDKGQDKNYSKNIIGYAAKKTIKLMFAKHTKYLSRKCKENGLNFRQFKKKYKTYETTISGPVVLKKVFQIQTESQNETKMRDLFIKSFTKILRKEYLIESLRTGKMKQHDLYIIKKNRELLYFPFRDQVL